jgi:hypothetical protein
MKRIVIDTNVYSDAMRGIEGSVSVFQRHEGLLFAPVVIGELYAGFRRGKQEDKNRLQLKKMLAKERVIELSITAEPLIFTVICLPPYKKAAPLSRRMISGLRPPLWSMAPELLRMTLTFVKSSGSGSYGAEFEGPFAAGIRNIFLLSRNCS